MTTHEWRTSCPFRQLHGNHASRQHPPMNTHGPDLLGTARAIHRHSRADRARLQAFQDAKLRRLLVHAYEHVPYYHKLFDRHRLHPRHIRGAVDLDRIPLTTGRDRHDLPASEMLAKGVDAASPASA